MRTFDTKIDLLHAFTEQTSYAIKDKLYRLKCQDHAIVKSKKSILGRLAAHFHTFAHILTSQRIQINNNKVSGTF